MSEKPKKDLLKSDLRVQAPMIEEFYARSQRLNQAAENKAYAAKMAKLLEGEITLTLVEDQAA